MKNETLRNHYIPQMYLKNFSQQSFVTVFDRKDNSYRRQHLVNTGLEKNLYPNEIEKFLWTIENKSKSILQSILDKKQLNVEERAIFATFLAYLATRTPDFKKTIDESFNKTGKRVAKIMFSNKTYADQTIKEIYGNIESTEKNKIIEFITNEQAYDIKAHDDYWLHSMLKIPQALTQIFEQLDWNIAVSDKQYAFITSDNPIYVLPPEDLNNHIRGYGYATKGATIVMPIASNICLTMHDPEKERTPTIKYLDMKDKDYYKKVNYMTAIHSDRFIYAALKDKLTKVIKETKVDKWLRKDRVVVN